MAKEKDELKGLRHLLEGLVSGDMWIKHGPRGNTRNITKEQIRILKREIAYLTKRLAHSD